MENITEQLEAIVRQGTGYMTLSQLKDKIGSPLRKRLGIASKPTAPQIQKALEPYLGEVLAFRKGGQSEYIILKMSDEELLFRIVKKRSGKTAGVIGDKIPFKKGEYIDVLNRLLEKGRVRVTMLRGDEYKPVIEPALSDPSVEISEKSPRFPVMTTTATFTEDAFHAAYRDLAQGRYSVRIYDLRRRLAWPRETFDAMLKTLRDRQAIQLQSGESENLVARDIEDAFRDESGFLKLTLMWRQL